jgi:hypothetical protein
MNLGNPSGRDFLVGQGVARGIEVNFGLSVA